MITNCHLCQWLERGTCDHHTSQPLLRANQVANLNFVRGPLIVFTRLRGAGRNPNAETTTGGSQLLLLRPRRQPEPNVPALSLACPSRHGRSAAASPPPIRLPRLPAPFQELHRNELPTVLLADFKDGADVEMIQSGGRLCLAIETARRL